MKILAVRSSWLLTFIFIVTAIIMTIYEAIKEFIFNGALTAWESHTITITVTACIATLTAMILRTWLHSFYIREKELDKKQEDLESFKLILAAVNHIVNNVLNYLQLVKVDIEMKGKVEEETLELLEFSIREAALQMKLLNEIKDPHDPKSYTEIYPKPKTGN